MQCCVGHRFYNGQAGRSRLLVDCEESVEEKCNSPQVAVEPDKVPDVVVVQTLDEVGNPNSLLLLVAGNVVGSRLLDKIDHVEE